MRFQKNTQERIEIKNKKFEERRTTER